MAPTRPLAALTELETEVLCSLARDGRVLELGTYRGRSTLALAAVASEVWTVDWHRGAPGMKTPDSLPDYWHNLQESGLADKVVSLAGRFAQALPRLESRSFDLVFVDGWQDLADARFNLLQASRLVRAGGTITAHDWGRGVVDRAAADLGFPAPLVHDSLAVWPPGPGR